MDDDDKVSESIVLDTNMRSIWATYTCSNTAKSACATSLLASCSLRHGDTGDEVRSSQTTRKVQIPRLILKHLPPCGYILRLRKHQPTRPNLSLPCHRNPNLNMITLQGHIKHGLRLTAIFSKLRADCWVGSPETAGLTLRLQHRELKSGADCRSQFTYGTPSAMGQVAQ